MTTMHQEAMGEHAKVLLADLVAVPFAAIPPEDVIPLWPGWIPRRHATLVAAPGGTSKGLWSVDIIARVTTGRPWPGEPDDAVHEPEAAILIAPEDDPNEAVAWRLKAAKADTSLVFNLTILPDGEQFMVPESIPELRAAVKQIETLTGHTVGAVVIDPLLQVVHTKLPGRKEWNPIEGFARKPGTDDMPVKSVPAVIVNHHTVKGGTVAGMKELTNAARHVLRIERPDKSSPARIITVEKSNMGDDTARIAYALTGGTRDVRVVYAGDVAKAGVSRGYTVDFSGNALSWKPAPPLPKPSSWQILMAERGQEKPVKLGEAADAELAKKAAQDHAGHDLPWAPGDHGSYYAGTVLPGNKFAAYTVFPNAA